MKRLFGVLLLLVMVFILCACDDSNSKAANTVSAADLSDMENAILSTTSNQSFVFEFNKDSDYKEVSVWIEKYKDGELVDDKLGQLSSEAEDNGSIIFTSQKEIDETKQHTFNVGITSDGSTGSTVGLDNDVDNKLSASGSFQENEKSLEEGEAVLAGIIYSKGEGDTISFRSNFYEDASELKKYEVVYLFKAEFIE